MSMWKFSEQDWQEYSDDTADDFIQAQRSAFLAGYKAAARESQEFRRFREWLEDERDDAQRQYEESGETGDLARRMAFTNTLVKLSEIGCEPDD